MSMVILLKLLIWFEVGLLLACPGGCLFVTELLFPPAHHQRSSGGLVVCGNCQGSMENCFWQERCFVRQLQRIANWCRRLR